MPATDEYRMVTLLTSTIYATDEMLLDSGAGTPEQRARWSEAIERRRQESEDRWRALSPWTRAVRRLRWRRYEAEVRLAHVMRALRGERCD